MLHLYWSSDCECVMNHRSTHGLIPGTSPAPFHACRARWSCCWPCAETSSHLTGDQPTSHTSSAQSHTPPTGTEWSLRVMEETYRLWVKMFTVNTTHYQVVCLSAFSPESNPRFLSSFYGAKCDNGLYFCFSFKREASRRAQMFLAAEPVW